MFVPPAHQIQSRPLELREKGDGLWVEAFMYTYNILNIL